MSAEQRLRRYVARQLQAGVDPADLGRELTRYRVPPARARALIAEALRSLPPTDAAGSGSPGGARVGPAEFGDYMVALLGQGYDIQTVLEQADEHGYTREEARRILSESSDPRVLSLLQSVPAASPAGEQARPGLHERIPVPPENAAGQLSPEQRRLLRWELKRCLSWMIVVVPATGLAIWLLTNVAALLAAPAGQAGVAPSVTAALASLFVRSIPLLVGLFVGVSAGLIGSVALLVDVARLALDLVSGRVEVARTHLRQPFETGSGDRIGYTITLQGFPRRYQLWGRDLFDLVARWGLDVAYDVYLSPRSRWVWHLEPVEGTERETG